MSPRSWYASLLAVAALSALSGCSREETPAAPSASARERLRVSVETVSMRDVAGTVEAVGTVRSYKQSALSSRIVALVRTVHVREGDRVAAGQPLIELDDREVTAQRRHAEAALVEAQGAREETLRAIAAADRAVEAATAQQELARTTWTRYRRLLDQGIVAAQEYDETAARYRVAAAEVARAHEIRASLLARQAQAEAAIVRAEADVDSARVTAGFARIVAPANVIVVSRTVEAGNLAAPGTVLLTVEDERYRLEATVQESELPRLRLGARAALTVDALGGATTTGSIEEIVPAADPLSRTFVVKVSLPALPGLKSGLYGHARFDVGRRRALTVPRGAISERGQLDTVFVVGDGSIAALRLVKTGRTYDDRVEIVSGLSEGEAVVVDGVERLSDRRPVQVGP